MRAERLGCVLDGLHRSRYSVVVSLEIYQTQFSLVAATTVAGGELVSGLRPPVERFPTVRDFYGALVDDLRTTSSPSLRTATSRLNTPIILCLCPGVVGLNFFTAIIL